MFPSFYNIRWIHIVLRLMVNWDNGREMLWQDYFCQLLSPRRWDWGRQLTEGSILNCEVVWGENQFKVALWLPLFWILLTWELFGDLPLKTWAGNRPKKGLAESACVTSSPLLGHWHCLTGMSVPNLIPNNRFDGCGDVGPEAIGGVFRAQSSPPPSLNTKQYPYVYYRYTTVWNFLCCYVWAPRVLNNEHCRSAFSANSRNVNVIPWWWIIMSIDVSSTLPHMTLAPSWQVCEQLQSSFLCLSWMGIQWTIATANGRSLWSWQRAHCNNKYW